MSGLETAIRNALERSERANPEIRARIYQSARQALEAGLRKQDVTDAETVALQRERLESTIRAVEREERLRLMEQAASSQPEAPRPAPPRPADPPVRQSAVPSRQEPPMVDAPLRGETRDGAASSDGDRLGGLDDMRAGRDDHLGAVPEPAESAASVTAGTRSLDFKPERAAVRRKPRKIFSRLLVFCVLLAFLGMGAWWVKTSGVLLTSAQRDTSVRNPPASVASQDYDGSNGQASNGNAGLATIDPQSGFSEEWIEVFKPSETAGIAGGLQAKIESVAENEGPAIRLTSATGGAEGNAEIQVPANVLQQLAGKASTVALTLQATSDTPSQVTVECDFQSLGTCGRHRFDVTREKTDALFQIRFDRSLAPTSPGKLIINSDIDGKGRSVDIYAIRILPGE